MHLLLADESGKLDQAGVFALGSVGVREAPRDRPGSRLFDA